MASSHATRALVGIAIAATIGCSGGDDSSALEPPVVPPNDATSGALPDVTRPPPTQDSGVGGQDTSTFDSAQPDASTCSADGGPLPPPPGDAGACTGLVYCDDFEAYGGNVTNGQVVGPWKATVSGMLTMAIDTKRAYSGTKSIHITVPEIAVAPDSGSHPAHGTLDQTGACGLVAGNNLFGRAMVYYESTGGYGLPLSVHSWIFNAGGFSDELDASMAMNMGGGGTELQLNYSPTDKSVDMGTMTSGKWHCLQWEYDGSGSPVADIAKIWIDKGTTPALTVPKSEGWKFATPWRNLSFGFTHYQNLKNPVEIYLDDFALDGKMIPCPP